MKRFAITIGSIALIVLAGGATYWGIKTFSDTSVRTGQTNATAENPEFTVTKLAEGLDHPWDVDFIPDGTMIITERGGDLSKVVNGTKSVIERLEDVDAQGEGGLMGLAIDPEFQKNRFVYACFNSSTGDIRVVRWVANVSVDGLTRRTDIVTGIPSAESGRHSGCQIAFGPEDNLWIGTGDAADETQPQDLTKLGGKILRVTREGKPAAGNVDGEDGRIYSYGHRNTQAIAFYETKIGTSFGVSVEHGPGKDDEVNQLVPGNFGWAPGAGYDESVPMTDTATFSDAIESTWASGPTTIAPSGAAFLDGSGWGRLEGWLAVSVLKDQKLLLLNIDGGKVNGTRSLFENEYGRLRAATIGPRDALYVSTDNGTDDVILRIAPSS